MTPRHYTYTLKLTTGERVVIDKATGIDDAMRQAGVMAHQVKRHMPVKAWPTEEEKQKTRERIERMKQNHRCTLDRYCKVCGEAKPTPVEVSAYERSEADQVRIDMTAAGPQYVIPDAPPREVPTTGLRAKRKQTERPTLLELYESEQKQIKLF